MNGELKKALRKAQPEDIIELEHALNIASNARKVCNLHFELTGNKMLNKEFAEIVKIPPRDVSAFMCGAYNYDLLHVSRLEAKLNELARELNKIEIIRTLKPSEIN